MIIFGTKGRIVEIGRGVFYCPNCQAQRQYSEKRASRYFSLYFIPLFPIQKLGEYVECETCHNKYKPEVLRMTPPAR